MKLQRREPTASIIGHVIGKGLRFGRANEKNPSGRYNTTFLAPGVPVLLHKHTNPSNYLLFVDKVFTNDEGFYEFKALPPGNYIISCSTGPAQAVPVRDSKPYYTVLHLIRH